MGEESPLVLTTHESDESDKAAETDGIDESLPITFAHRMKEYVLCAHRPHSGLYVRSLTRWAVVDRARKDDRMTELTLDAIVTGIRIRRDLHALPLEQVLVNYEVEHAEAHSLPTHVAVTAGADAYSLEYVLCFGSPGGR